MKIQSFLTTHKLLTAIVAIVLAASVGTVVVAQLSNSSDSNLPVSNTEVRTELEFETVSIPYKKKTVSDPSLPVGATMVKQKGVAGKKRVGYEVTYDSKRTELSRKQVSSNLVTKPVDQITLKGTKTASSASTYTAPTTSSPSRSDTTDDTAITCPPALISAAADLYKTAKNLYNTYVNAENSRHQGELSDIGTYHNSRGTLYSGGYQADINNENAYHATQLSNLKAEYDSEVASIDSRVASIDCL